MKIYSAILEGSTVRIIDTSTGTTSTLIPINPGATNVIAVGNVVTISYQNGRVEVRNCETGSLVSSY